MEFGVNLIIYSSILWLFFMIDYAFLRNVEFKLVARTPLGLILQTFFTGIVAIGINLTIGELYGPTDTIFVLNSMVNCSGCITFAV